MPADVRETLERQWTLLRLIPRWPQKSDARALHVGVLDKGLKPTRRTIERDLKELSATFPIVVDTKSRPYGWSWARDAHFEFMPRLTLEQCVALKLAQEHTRHLLPQSMYSALMPLFDAAARELGNSGWRDWHLRTFVKPPTFGLLPPAIDAVVLADVQHAIARRLMFKARYRKKGAKAATAMDVHPHGMLHRGPVQYVLGSPTGDHDIRTLAMHRMEAVELTVEPCREPPGFDIQAWAASNLALVSRGRVRVVLRFDPRAADHLLETPMSADQTWDVVEDGRRVEVTATVDEDELLRWWIHAFSWKVEVIEPVALREAIADELRRALAAYGG